MPAQSGTNPLARLSGRLTKIHESVKGKEVTYGNMQLPPGIEGGVAQLDRVKIGVFEDGPNKGEAYIMASGVVQTPREFGGVKTAGLRTQWGPEPLCDTPNSSGKRKTLEDHYDHCLNMLKQFDPETFSNIEFSELQAAIDQLNEAAPYFSFRTWKGRKQQATKKGNAWYVGTKGPYKSEEAAKEANPYLGEEPKTNHEWCGVCEFSPDQDDQTQDDTAEAPPPPKKPSANGQAGSPQNGPAAKAPAGRTRTKAPEPEPEPEADEGEGEAPSPGFSDQADIDTLVERAEQDDGADDKDRSQARDELTDLALSAGFTQDQVDDAPNWRAVADMISGGKADSGEGDAGEDAEPEAQPGISKGDMVFYKPIDPKTKKPGRRVQCQVLTVNEATRMVTLKSMTTTKPILGPDGKTPLKVSFDALEAD